MPDDVGLVLAWIEASQRARSSQRRQDYEALRQFLADDVQVKLASAWTDSPWRIAYTSANQMVEQLVAPINQGSVLRTENTNVVHGTDVLVEQLPTTTRDGHDYAARCATSSPSRTAGSSGCAPTAMTTASRQAET